MGRRGKTERTGDDDSKPRDGGFHGVSPRLP
jgi:hypothetical protein